MPKEDTQFKPGQSGNPKGRPKKRPFAAEMEEQIAKNPELLANVVHSALVEAGRGNNAAQKLVSEIMDGKPMQQVELSGDSDNPVVTVNKIELVGVKPAKD